MRSSRSLPLASCLIAATLAIGVGAPRQVEAGRLARALRLDRLKDIGIIASVGVDYGVPGVGVGGGGEVGFKLSPVEPDIGRHRFAPFVAATASAVVASVSAVGSTRRKWSGTERFVGVVGRGHPIYGDRVSVPIIPGVLGIAASRSGGLGLWVSLLPLPFHLGGALAHPFLRGSAQLYVTHPKLARFSNKLLDRVDRISRKIDRVARPVTVRFRWKVVRPLKHAWKSLRHKTGRGRDRVSAPRRVPAHT